MSHARGQAVVELALGTLVFVTVLLFGIHFAELGMVKLRTQQAASSALWDTTGLRAHNLRDKQFYRADRLRDAQSRTPEQRAQALYRDFDGRSDAEGGGVQLAMTRGSRLRVDCDPHEVAPMPQGRGATAAAFDVLRAGYGHPRDGRNEVDGMSCQAQARVQPFGVPRDFMDDGRGFFTVDQVLRPSLTVCAFGRASGGECRGGVPIAIDDWGLAGSDRQFGRPWERCDASCVFNASNNPPGNQAYKKTVERLYDEYKNLTILARAFAIPTFLQTLFTQDPGYPQLRNVPVDERQFRFVFIGEQGMMPRRPDDNDGPGYEPRRPFHFSTREVSTTDAFNYSWASSPYSRRYERAHQRRGECFLGSRCARPLFDKKRW